MADRNRYQRYRFQSAGSGGFPGLTPMVKRLLIANGVIFLAQGWLPLVELGSLNSYFVIQRGFIWQPFTYMWLHGGLMHLVFNMFALWMFGGQLEQVWGSRRFLRFYLTCGVGAGVLILLWNYLTNPSSFTLGASGAIYGVLTAFSLMWPDRTIMLLFPPIPIRAIWLLPLLFVLQILMDRGSNISHIGHLGGVIVAAVILRKESRRYLGLSSLRHRWYRWRMRNRLRTMRREEWEKRRNDSDDQDRYH